MGTAVLCVDIVGKGEHHVVVAVVVLHGYLRKGVALSTRNIYNISAYGFVSAYCVKMLDKLTDTALIVESFTDSLCLVALIREYYLDSRIEKCLLAETLQEHLVLVNCALEYLVVSLEHYAGTCFFGIADDL